MMNLTIKIKKISKSKIALRDNSNNVRFKLIDSKKEKWLFNYFNEKLEKC